MARAITSFCKAMSDPNRFRIAVALAQSDLCVCELADALQLGQSTISNHLAKMRAHGLVSTRRDGNWIYYQINPACQKQLVAMLAAFRNDVAKDKVLNSDANRLEKRLSMRIDGKCMRSYGGLRKK